MDATDKPTRWMRIAPWAVVLVYLGFCFFRIGRQGFDKDELITFDMTTRSFVEIMRNRLSWGHLPLYFMVVKAWTALAGASYGMLLLPSMVIGIIAMIGMLRLGRWLGFGAWSSALMLVLALHPSFLYCARYARPWMGVIALWIWITLYWLMLVRQPRERYKLRLTVWLALGVVGAMWNHAVAALWLVLMVGTACSGALRHRVPRSFWVVPIAVLLLHGTMTLLAVVESDQNQPLDWIKPATFGSLLNVLCEWLVGTGPELNRFRDRLFLLPLFLWLLARGLRRGRSPEDLVLTATWATPLLCLVLTALLPHPLLRYRYGSLLLPGLIVLVGSGLVSMQRRRAVVVLCLIVAAEVLSFKPMIGYRHNRVRAALNVLAKEYHSPELIFVDAEPSYRAVRMTLPGVIPAMLDLDATTPSQQINAKGYWFFKCLTDSDSKDDEVALRRKAAHESSLRAIDITPRKN